MEIFSGEKTRTKIVSDYLHRQENSEKRKAKEREKEEKNEVETVPKICYGQTGNRDTEKEKKKKVNEGMRWSKKKQSEREPSTPS